MISVITPTVRPEGLDIVWSCLKKQDVDFEWIIVSPYEVTISDPRIKVLKAPPKKKGHYYALNRDWNMAYSEAKGDLIIDIVDFIWFPPDTLERLLTHYQVNPKALVTTVGHQYKEIVNGKPEDLVWQDPRARSDFGTFYEVAPSEMEMCVASLPKQAILDCGGLDEVYDTCPAVSEKEMCWRLDKLGYKFYIDQSIEYRALQHPRLREDWDEKYLKLTTPLFTKHMKELEEGTRKLNVGFVLT